MGKEDKRSQTMITKNWEVRIKLLFTKYVSQKKMPEW